MFEQIYINTLPIPNHKIFINLFYTIVIFKNGKSILQQLRIIYSK